MTTTAKNPWPPQLILDIALESHDVGDLLTKHDLTQEELDHLYTLPQFTREILHARAELAATGSTFRAHARVLAEEHLMTMNDLLNNKDVPTSQKIDLWRSLVEYASLKPPKEAAAGPSSAAVTINIAGYAAAPPKPIIDITPEKRPLNA
jgi:hypothetical protein